MKRSICAMLLLAGCATTQAAQRPAAGSGDVAAADVNGMKVLVKRIPGAEFVSVALGIKGGVRSWTKDDAGVGEFAFQVAARGGTESMERDAFQRKLASLGATLYGTANNDYAVMGGKSLRDVWGPTFEMLADAFLHPAMPAAEIELQRQRHLSFLKREQEHPESQLELATHEATFKGHPYENRAMGTLENVTKLGRAELVAWLGRQRQTSRLVLVVVGDVDVAEVAEKARATFGQLPRGEAADAPLPPITFDAAKVVTIERKLPTHYVRSVFPAPGWRDADLPAAIVGMKILHEREFVEVRTKRNLSYGPGARLAWGAAVARGILLVSAVDPNTTMKVMLDEVKRLRDEPVPEKELTSETAGFLTRYLMGLETTDGQAGMLLQAEISGGDHRLAASLAARVRAVTQAEVQAFAKKYFKNLRTVVIGTDVAKLDQALLTAM